jgi:lantibiotic modifying enzyme
MAVFYEVTGEERFLAAARDSSEYLEHISVKQGEGFLVPVMDDGDCSTFYLGACHGSAGTTKLFYKLYRLTGEDHYKETIEAMSKGILNFGAPEIQSAGYWNNTCICCGTASLLQFYTRLYVSFGNPHYLDVAKRAAKVVLGEAEYVTDGAIAWPLAEVRAEPANISTSKGYLHGAAGIGCALLQYYQVVKGIFDWNRLLDDPYPAQNLFDIQIN